MKRAHEALKKNLGDERRSSKEANNQILNLRKLQLVRIQNASADYQTVPTAQSTEGNGYN